MAEVITTNNKNHHTKLHDYNNPDNALILFNGLPEHQESRW